MHGWHTHQFVGGFEERRFNAIGRLMAFKKPFSVRSCMATFKAITGRESVDGITIFEVS